MENPFFTAMNSTTCAAAAVCGEQFIVIKNGNLGTYDAVSIDEIDASAPVAMKGGKYADISVRLFVTKCIFEQAKINDGTVLEVRGKQVRVSGISNGGGDSVTIDCGPAGLKVS